VIGRAFPYIPPVRRTAVSRTCAGLLSLWLAICMVEPAQLHTCAMHGGLAIEQTSGSGTHANHHAHHAAMHESTRSDRGHHTDPQSRQCSCLGDCNGGSATVGLPAATVSVQAIAAIDGSKALVEPASPTVSAGSYVLPFANGPPRNSFRA
jgi:hypothetical protein